VNSIERFIQCAVLVVLTLAPVARAQTEIQVQAQIEPPNAYLGSTLTYTVSVQTIGQHDISSPDLDLPAGLRLLGNSTSFESRTRPVRQTDGTFQLNMVMRRSFHYTLSADRIGVFSIPPARVLVDGSPHESDATTVNVREPQSVDGFELESRLSKTRVYVGEPFTLFVTWFVGQDVRDFSFVGPDLPNFVRAQPVFSASAPQDRAGRYPATTLYGQRIYGTRGEATLNNRRVSTVTFRVQYIASQAGTLELGPLAMIFDAVEGRSVTRGVARTGPISVEVLPLPSVGRPAGFDGLIGRYDISAAATPTAVNVGDPINLVVRIDGPDARLVNDGPNLAALPAFAEQFKFDPAGWEREQGTTTQAVFQTTVRALDESIIEIPSVELPYFDTDAGVYQIARSAPIPMTVRPSRVVSLDDAIVSPGSSPSIARQELGDARGGIWAIAPIEVLTNDPIHRSLSSWWIVPIVAIPPLLWLGLVVRDWRATRSAHPSIIHQRQYRRALRLARSGRSEDAVRSYLGTLTGQRPEAVTAADCHTAIEDRDIAQQAASLLGANEASRFGQTSQQTYEPVNIEPLIRAMHKNLRGQA